MNFYRIAVFFLLLFVSTTAFSIDISMGSTARLDVVSRTSFGIDLDNLYRFGLYNELTQVDLVFNLAPYQQLTNRVNSPEAVGFIEFTLFHLDLIKIGRSVGYNPPGTMGHNRYQTGEFLAGIANGPWVFQFNAGGNEPFSSPWNKGMQFINDGFKFSWAYLDSMVDIRRIRYISDITGRDIMTGRGEENMDGAGQTMEHPTMKQYGFDSLGNIADRLGMNLSCQMVAAMYNSENFGLNLKFGTRLPFYDEGIDEDNPNGLAVGIDTVFNRFFLDGIKVFFSMIGTYNWSVSTGQSPLAAGTRIGYNIPLVEGVSVEPWAGFDIRTRYDKDGEFQDPGYEASVGFNMRFPGEGGWLTDYIINSDGRVFPGMSLGYKIFEDKAAGREMEHTLKFTLFEPRGDEGMFFMLGSEIILEFIDITNVNFGMPATTNDPPGGFTILGTAYFDLEFNNVGRIPGTLRPWTIFYFDNLPGETKESERITDTKIDLGFNFENTIPNTVLGIVWNSGSMLQRNRTGFLRCFVEIRL